MTLAYNPQAILSDINCSSTSAANNDHWIHWTTIVTF